MPWVKMKEAEPPQDKLYNSGGSKREEGGLGAVTALKRKGGGAKGWSGCGEERSPDWGELEIAFQSMRRGGAGVRINLKGDLFGNRGY